MPRPQTNEVLNRLFVTLYRSLAMYLEYASPWKRGGDDKAIATVQHVVADQKALCQRIANYILDHHGRVDTGEYAMYFTGLHDVSLEYVIGQLVQAQRSDIAAIEQCVGQLQHDPAARALAEETLGTARGHLDELEELRAAPAGSSAS